MSDWADAPTQPHVPRHRRDGVPLDGAPDLGLFATGPLSKAAADPPPPPWEVQPDGFEHLGESPDSGTET